MSVRNRRDLLALFAVLAAGCVEAKPEPQLATSATSPTYAQRFPEELSATMARFNYQESEEERLAKEFAGYPDDLDEPSWAEVADVARYADQEGHSRAYVERIEEMKSVASFFQAEGDAIHRKLAGSVQYAAKKNDCDAKLGSQAVAALDRALDERIEERLHETSDAQVLIDQNEAALGKKNAEKLREQADGIARASYLARVGVVETRLELQRMLDDLEKTKGTLDRMERDLAERANNPDLDDAERREAEARLAAVKEAKAKIEGQLPAARDMNQGAERRVEQIQRDYTEAFEALIAEIERRQSAEPAPK